jgi:hypothetical protein
MDYTRENIGQKSRHPYAGEIIMGIIVYIVYLPVKAIEFQTVTQKHKSFTLGGIVYLCFLGFFGVELIKIL